jgi:replication-associated recombination protein RarA
MDFFFRMSLLLGPPGSGKTSLLLALAGKLDSSLKVSHILHSVLVLSRSGCQGKTSTYKKDCCNIDKLELEMFRCQEE